MHEAEQPPPAECHAITFFADADELCAEVARFVATGLARHEPAMLVTTPEHRAGIGRELEGRSIDVDATVAAGDLLLLDAEETLSTLMVGGLPDPRRYHRDVGDAVRQILDGRPGPVRIFGDMVDLLWTREEYDAAIRIELLSNQLAVRHPISVICGYSMGHFLKGAVELETVRDLHGRIHRAGSATRSARRRAGQGPGPSPR